MPYGIYCAVNVSSGGHIDARKFSEKKNFRQFWREKK
jgi:hypothetical protein